MLEVNTAGEIVYANPAAERILGLSFTDIVARTYHAPEWIIEGPEGGAVRPEELPASRALRCGAASPA